MKKKYLIIVISLICATVALSAAAIILLLNSPEKADKAANATEVPSLSETAAAAEATGATAEASAARDASAAADESSAPDPSAGASSQGGEAAATQPASEARASAPEELGSALETVGQSLQSVGDIGCSQLVTVSSSGSSAQIRFYSMENGVWTENESLSCYGFVGRNGVTTSMHEGGNASPWGFYGIGEAFYQYDAPQTGLSSFEITSDTYWVDDPSSSHYNQKVVGTSGMDWNSAEHMAEISGYRYGFVIDYNSACVPGDGSAIFFHISSGPTAGCVGTDESNVLNYLRELDASKNPHIIIM